MRELEVLRQKVEHLEREIQDLKIEMKELDKRVDNHDTLLSKIEVIVEGLSVRWTNLESKIDAAITNTNSNWSDVVKDILKWSTVIVGAILGAKILL